MTLCIQHESQIFPPTTGGAEKMCVDMDVPLLGKLPLDPRIGNTQILYIPIYKINISQFII